MHFVQKIVYFCRKINTSIEKRKGILKSFKNVTKLNKLRIEKRF